jgi:protein involved in sex pheromone biosynthesis
MPRLRRFAFTLSAVRFGDHAINALTTQLLARLRNKALLPFEAQGLEGVYRLLITYFAAHAKSLEEVCITSRYPMFYRATFTDGVWKMSQESFDDHSENYLFPTVLDG